VLTAAHCLPFFPPCASFSDLSERTYKNLLGPIGQKRTIWAECLFVDPISDIAVLGSPDNQALSANADAYLKFTEHVSAVTLRDARTAKRGYSLRGDWFACSVSVQFAFDGRSSLWVKESAEGIAGGMSGSPIVADGHAIGMVCTGPHKYGVPHPFSVMAARRGAHHATWRVMRTRKRLDAPETIRHLASALRELRHDLFVQPNVHLCRATLPSFLTPS
jgi:hypothetical protein